MTNSEQNASEKVSVVLPAFNEAGNIETLMEKIDKVFKNRGIAGEAILINDGSTDETGDVARDCMKKYPFLRVYDHRKNLGLTKSLSNGFKRAKGDIIIFLCSDLQSDPEDDIPKLLEGFKSDADVVVGWRQDRKESKRFGSKIYNLVSNFLFNVNVHDQNWIKAFRKEFVQDLLLRSDWHRFLVAIAIYKGYKVVEVPTKWYPRTYGESKYNFLRIPIAVFDMFVLKIEMMFIENPIRIFGSIGFFFGFIGTCIIVFFLLLKYGAGIILPEYTRLKYFLVSILFILLGVGIFFMGLLGEFIVNYLENIKSKQQSNDR